MLWSDLLRFSGFGFFVRYIIVGSLDQNLGKRFASLRSLGFIFDMALSVCKCWASEDVCWIKFCFAYHVSMIFVFIEYGRPNWVDILGIDFLWSLWFAFSVCLRHWDIFWTGGAVQRYTVIQLYFSIASTNPGIVLQLLWTCPICLHRCLFWSREIHRLVSWLVNFWLGFPPEQQLSYFKALQPRLAVVHRLPVLNGWVYICVCLLILYISVVLYVLSYLCPNSLAPWTPI